jgi:hypothetical protein
MLSLAETHSNTFYNSDLILILAVFVKVISNLARD